VLTITFNRPTRHNALTWAICEALVEACERAGRTEPIRFMIL